MADPILATVQPVIEACCRALLDHESSVITIRELRDLLGKLDATIKSDMTTEARASTCMLLLRRVIDHSVRLAPLAFLKDPLSRTLSKTHEELKKLISPPEKLPPARGARHLRPD
jgi:hypothetical protein